MKPKRYLLPYGTHADAIGDELNCIYIVRKDPLPLGGRYGQLGNIETKFRCGVSVSMKTNRIIVTGHVTQLGELSRGGLMMLGLSIWNCLDLFALIILRADGIV